MRKIWQLLFCILKLRIKFTFRWKFQLGIKRSCQSELPLFVISCSISFQLIFNFIFCTVWTETVCWKEKQHIHTSNAVFCRDFSHSHWHFIASCSDTDSRCRELHVNVRNISIMEFVLNQTQITFGWKSTTFKSISRLMHISARSTLWNAVPATSIHKCMYTSFNANLVCI